MCTLCAQAVICNGATFIHFWTAVCHLVLSWRCKSSQYFKALHISLPPHIPWFVFDITPSELAISIDLTLIIIIIIIMSNKNAILAFFSNKIITENLTHRNLIQATSTRLGPVNKTSNIQENWILSNINRRAVCKYQTSICSKMCSLATPRQTNICLNFLNLLIISHQIITTFKYPATPNINRRAVCKY